MLDYSQVTLKSTGQMWMANSKIDHILNHLYGRYYADNKEFSASTSSHWRKFGKQQLVSMSNGVPALTGIGFGDFKKKE
jgi:hypothetical protein